MRKDIKGGLAWLWREWIKSLLIIVAIVGAFRSAVADWNDVPSGSMKPTILPGDRVVVNRLAYDLKLPFTRVRVARWNSPRRGDIVVLFSPADNVRLVKRVVGIPGDTVALRNDRLVINGRPLEYTQRAMSAAGAPAEHTIRALEHLGDDWHELQIVPKSLAMRSFGPVLVPAGDYFVMGDNRDQSSDSRVFGFVARDRIVGRAFAVAASLDPERHYLPRWQRFLRALH
jgi:signal peptidase I